jgi:flagellar export protein FliJ
VTAFRFRLERVLEWRRAALAAAEACFRQQSGAVAGLDRVRASLEAAGLRAEMLIRQSPGVSGAELAAFGEFRRHLRTRQREIAAAMTRAQAELATRHAALLEARRRVRLLERLRERRFSEWNEAAAREIEQLASESHLARLARVR